MNLKYCLSLHICLPNTLGGHYCRACFTAVAFFMPFLEIAWFSLSQCKITLGKYELFCNFYNCS